MKEQTKPILLESLAILAISFFLAVTFHFSFIIKGLKGELVIRPDLEKNEMGDSEKAPRKIKLDEAWDRFAKKSAIFVDARAHLFYQVGHIRGALSFPREEFEKIGNLAPLLPYKGKLLVIYCSGADCPDSSLLAVYLLKEGFRHLEIFEDGWPAWEAAGYPVEK